MLDILRRSDVTARLVVQLQGIPEDWTCVGDATSDLGGTAKPLIANRDLELRYGAIEPLKGIANSGHLGLELLDLGGYVSGLLDDGIETLLTQDVEPADAVIHVVSTAAFPSVGKLYIHRECITYTGKTALTFTGCTRTSYEPVTGIYAPAHRIDKGWGNVNDGVGQGVRVGSTPLYLEGRYITVTAVALDYGGKPIYDDDGRYYWEIWRGLVTACSPSPDAMTYALQAETMVRTITDKAPVHGISGSLITGAWGSQFGAGGNAPWGVWETPIFIPWRRRMLYLYYYNDGAGFAYDGTVGAVVLDASSGQMRTLGQISDAFYQSAVSSLVDMVTFQMSVKKTYDDSGHPVGQSMVLTVCFDMLGAPAGYNIDCKIAHSSDSCWKQLGAIGTDWTERHTVGELEYFKFHFDELPATLMLMPDDDEIPVASNGAVAETQGWIGIGDEAIYYDSYNTDEIVDGVQIYALQSCMRGLAGTLAESHVYRMGASESSDMPTVEPIYVLGGNNTMGSDEPDTSVWISLLKLLTGCNGECDANGTYAAWPGLGIPTEHLDVDAIEALQNTIPLVGPLYGRVEDLRSWLSDALALEGYALVTRPLADGSCRLTPVRVGAQGTHETALTLDIEAQHGVTVHGGLSQIVNKLSVKSKKATADFYDSQSIERFGVRQERSFELPLADQVGGMLYLADSARRVFAMAGSRDFLKVGLAVDPGGRMVAPGDLLSLTFPNTALTGTYRVLEGATPLRGQGPISVLAMKADIWTNHLYAPTSEIQSIASPAITVETGDGQWYKAGADVWVYDPDDYSDGYTKTIQSISGDVLTLDNTTNLASGDLVEFDDYTARNGEARYVWFVASTFQWGD